MAKKQSTKKVEPPAKKVLVEVPLPQSPIKYLINSYIITRILIVFVFVPLVHKLWNKKSHGLPVDDRPEYRSNSLSLLSSFDALHFEHIALNGYTHEKNHAFFPGYPILLSLLRSAVDDRRYFEVGAFILQLYLGAANANMIYNVTIKLLNNQFFYSEKIQDQRYPQ